MSGRDRHRRVTHAGVQDLAGPVDTSSAITHGEQRADHRPHLVVTERIRVGRHGDHTLAIASYVE